MNGRRRQPSVPSMACPRAFSLIEIIVVIALLSVLAGVLLPRMAGAAAREARQEAQSLRELLTSAAERDAFSSQPVAVQFQDASRGQPPRFVLLAQREEGSGNAVTVRWRPDPFVPPVALSRLKLRRATADGRELDRSSFLVDLAGSSLSGPRPAISLLLEGEGTGAWRVDLFPDSAAAVAEPVTAGAGRIGPSSPVSRSVDLDESGRSLDPW